jgi:hypothetical protein
MHKRAGMSLEALANQLGTWTSRNPGFVGQMLRG